MIFVIDVGNTNIVFGLYKDDKLLMNWRMGTDKNKASDEYGMFYLDIFRHVNIEITEITAVLISSVVPPIMYSLEHSIRKYFQKDPIVIGPGIKTGMNIKIENPKEVGADRIVNAVAAYEIYGGPIIIIDFGTATTFCAVSDKGEYLGGAISPGIKIGIEALYSNAAKLPRIEISKPAKVIGKNTVNSMKSGIVFGYIGQVEYIVKKMKKEMDRNDVKVVATGGFANMIAAETAYIDEINPLLTLEGLKIIYNRLSSKRIII